MGKNDSRRIEKIQIAVAADLYRIDKLFTEFGQVRNTDQNADDVGAVLNRRGNGISRFARGSGQIDRGNIDFAQHGLFEILAVADFNLSHGCRYG